MDKRAYLQAKREELYQIEEELIATEKVLREVSTLKYSLNTKPSNYYKK